MAGTIIAYSEITILDLIDTATYIYYSANENGTGASTAPDVNTKYIGIYSGPALEGGQPSVPPEDTNWSKYVGKDGTNGKDGNGIKSITYYYLTNNSSSMPSDSSITSTAMEMPTSTNKFLWQKEVIKYTNGTPQTTVSLLSVYGDKGEDGADGILYNIQTNHEKIYKFYDFDSTGVSYSPDEITFQAFKIENNENSLLNPLSDYNYDITMISNSNNNSFKHIVSFLNNLYVKNSDEDETLVTLLNKIIDINTNTKSITFKFGSLRNYVLITGDGNTLSNIDSFEELKRLINQENIYFIFKIYRFESGAIEPDNKDLLAVKPIAFEFGTNEEMAKFAITASSINAAVQSTKFTFDADGLTIQNGRFEIKDNNGDTLLGYTPPLEGGIGLLEIKGNGEFTGTIHAEKGSFTGDVIAETLQSNTGHIGGFLIEDGGLYSEDNITYNYFNTADIEPRKDKHYYYLDDNNEYVLFSDENFEPGVIYYERDIFSSIRLIGKTGQIDAEKINLGTGAHINSYIKLTNPNDKNDFVTIWNPYVSGSENKFIDTKFLKIYADSTMILGAYDENEKFNGLRFDGAQSKISGKSFSITPDLATFNNINVSGKISTAVFEQNHVQSVGGSMIFKPSYKVEGYRPDENGDVLTLDREFSGKIDNGTDKNYVYLVKTDGSLVQGQISIISKDDETKTVVISSNLNLKSQSENNSQLENNSQSENDLNPLVSLIDIGTEGSLVIGINSNEGGTGFLRPYGLTVAEFTTGESQNPKVFFGNLEKSGITLTGSQGLKGFGLYSENVYLTGSLTTQINNNSGSTYAGVNTLNSATASKFDSDVGVIPDNSKIVFWAGATNLSGVADAPFQVTEAGSLYARQGLFEEAIISKSEIKGAKIKGADIYAARIHGEGVSPNGLSFYDTNNGIVFYNGDPYVDPQTKEEEVFSIGNDGLKTKDDYFIKIQDGQNKQDKYIKFIGNEIQTSFLRLKDNQILGYHLKKDASEEVYANIDFNEEGLSFGLNTQGDFVINSNEIQLKKDTVKMNKTVLFGERLKYEQISDGYNLYVL